MSLTKTDTESPSKNSFIGRIGHSLLSCQITMRSSDRTAWGGILTAIRSLKKIRSDLRKSAKPCASAPSLSKISFLSPKWDLYLGMRLPGSQINARLQSDTTDGTFKKPTRTIGRGTEVCHFFNVNNIKSQSNRALKKFSCSVRCQSCTLRYEWLFETRNGDVSGPHTGPGHLQNSIPLWIRWFDAATVISDARSRALSLPEAGEYLYDRPDKYWFYTLVKCIQKRSSARFKIDVFYTSKMVGASNPKIAQCELTHDKHLLDKRTKPERIVTRPPSTLPYLSIGSGHLERFYRDGEWQYLRREADTGRWKTANTIMVLICRTEIIQFYRPILHGKVGSRQWLWNLGSLSHSRSAH
jgi:hypothetical protein